SDTPSRFRRHEIRPSHKQSKRRNKEAPPAPKPRRKKQRTFNLEEARENLRRLNAPVTELSGVGEKMAEKLSHLGASTIGELLYLFPRRYDDYTRMLPLNRLEPNQTYTVVGTIRKLYQRRLKSNRDLLVVLIDDGTATMEMNFFNQQWLRRQLKEGMQLVFSGKTDLFLGRVVMTNPAWEPIDQKSLHTGGIVPIFPLTKGISARTMRRVMHKMVDQWADKLVDFLPESVLDRTEQVDLSWALKQIHFPQKWEYLEYARERLAFDELILLQLGVMQNRREWQLNPAPMLRLSDEQIQLFENALPFTLTGAQKRSMRVIVGDLAKDVPMNRLLQGDVGSGKTVVAAFTMTVALLNGRQAALMAPTSILAEQHYQKIGELFATVPGLENTRVALLTGSLSESERREVYAGLADGSIHVVIGTHAIIQEGVEFHDLAAVVIDEQHRFGVEQRGVLRGKGTNPHVLVMTATPIPRTLALTLFADLDLSVLDEMPPGRTPIQTRL
ncbi:MAG TPA: ATP-dependent DNA helicase RecG, partial [Aggregatilineales bacterium]|nr:ATP-dependent DNA helicase RecG [Aggregatilineales bacterium]